MSPEEPLAARTLLEEALEAWGYTREGVVSELENLPADAMDHRPAPGARTVAELVHHIAESGLLMAGELARDDGDFTRQPYGDHLSEHAGDMPRPSGRSELLALLASTHAEGEARLRAVGELHLLGPIRRFDGVVGTRLAWLHHGIDHESYHRGQLALYARTLGVTPALTRRIRGES